MSFAALPPFLPAQAAERDGIGVLPGVDRSFWEAKGSWPSMALLQRLLQLVQSVTGDPTIALKYNKQYIGLVRHGVSDNFMGFKPRMGVVT